MFNKKKLIYFLLWVITILIAIIFTFENPHKIQALKDKLIEINITLKYLGLATNTLLY